MAIVRTTENGAELCINEASFEKANELKKSFVEELKKLDYHLNLEDNTITDIPSAICKIISLIMDTDTSPRFEHALFDCLEFCTYDGAKVNVQLFDDILKARSDYYEIVKGCVEVNLSPFFKSLNSQFPILRSYMEIYQSILTTQVGI